MAYGLSTRAPIKADAIEQVTGAKITRSTATGWRALSEACRLEVIEQALRAANDRIDGYPLAL